MFFMFLQPTYFKSQDTKDQKEGFSSFKSITSNSSSREEIPNHDNRRGDYSSKEELRSTSKLRDKNFTDRNSSFRDKNTGDNKRNSREDQDRGYYGGPPGHEKDSSAKIDRITAERERNEKARRDREKLEQERLEKRRANRKTQDSTNNTPPPPSWLSTSTPPKIDRKRKESLKPDMPPPNMPPKTDIPPPSWTNDETPEKKAKIPTNIDQI